MKKEDNFLQSGLEQLAEKQMEEMDRMLAKQYGLPLSTHSDPTIQAQVMSELFSGIPIEKDITNEEQRTPHQAKYTRVPRG